LNSISKNASFSFENQDIENIQLDYNLTQTSDKLNRFDAALLSLGSTHGLISHNRKFYYDPLFNSLIPIYYDGLSGITEDQGSSWITPYLQTSVNVESIQNGSKSLLKDFKSLKSKNLEIKTELESYGYIISESKLNELFDKFEKHLTIIKNFDNTNQIEIRTKPIEYSLQKSYFEIINDEIYYCYYESCSKIKISETKSILNNEFKEDNIQIYLVQTHESKSNKVQKIEVADLSILVFGEPELKIDKENKIININLKNQMKK
jgi:hypothetical protein